jgi:hypothetical protein
VLTGEERRDEEEEEEEEEEEVVGAERWEVEGVLTGEERWEIEGGGPLFRSILGDLGERGETGALFEPVDEFSRLALLPNFTPSESPLARDGTVRKKDGEAEKLSLRCVLFCAEAGGLSFTETSKSR